MEKYYFSCLKEITKFNKFFFLLLLFFGNVLYAQTYEIDAVSGTTITTCSGVFYDSGGTTGGYTNFENHSVTFTSNNGGNVILNITAMDIEVDGFGGCYDTLFVYNGTSAIPANLIDSYCGTTPPATITSSGTSLHVVFTSDGSVTGQGWRSTVSCTTPPVTDTDGDGIADGSDICNGFDDNNNADGDTVPDGCDYDDDNDGILDINELGICATSNSTLNWNNLYAESTSTTDPALGDDPVVANANLTVNGTGVRLTRDGGGLSTQEYRVNNFESSGSSYTLYQKAENGGESRHSFEFDEPVYNLGFTLIDVDEGGANTTFIDEVELILTKTDGTTHTLSASEYTLDGQTFASNAFRGQTASRDRDVVINGVQAWIIKLEVVYKNLTTAPVASQFQFTGLSNFTFCNTHLDSDNDGRPNYLDTDSDNDGCFDALEGSNTGLTLSSVDSNGRLTGGVGSTGIPSSAGAGQTNVSSTNSGVTGGQCDDDGDGVINTSDVCDGYDDAINSDGDTVPDGCDLDDDNDGILDAVEGYCDQPLVANSTSGSGTLQDQLYFFNWTGTDFTNGIQNGDSQTFNLPDGLVVTATFSNATGNTSSFIPTDMNTWSGSSLKDMYNTSGTTEAFYGTVNGADVSFTVTFTATKSGNPYPLYLLALDAEATASGSESIQFNTNGGDWTLLESIGTGGSFSGAGSKTLIDTSTTLGNNSIYYSENASVLNVTINQGGLEGVAFGIRLLCDTDSDGIPNLRDTDSDNDGCPDSVESGGTDATKDGVLDGTGFDSSGRVTGGTGGYNGVNGTEIIS
ncbi:CshA/CshB family fibrillar adhesin-related protein, partial [Tenacibaculum halocynthiae]|uniref:CshA/CshB family fibrillar adhesin-related protein n=1 Tax=Tenacibaculum halocynthiae TaxID=1254437 RepID=UPI0038B46790